jgi:4-hydroxy-tetrahydrodipicolinate synthase
MEMIAYNIPSCTSSEIPAEVIIEAARRGWIRYCKESSGNLPYFKRLVTEGKEVGLRMLEGEEPHIPEGLYAGAWGIVPVCANFEPATYAAIYQAALRGDRETVAHAHERAMAVRQALLFAGPLWIAGIKYAMSVLGIGTGRPVSPLQPLTGPERSSIEAFINEGRTEGVLVA